MAINKNAYIRYMVIDECLTTWDEEDRISERIRQKCAEEVKLRDDYGYSAKKGSISPRLFQMDLKNMELIWGERARVKRAKFKFGQNAGKYFYTYEDPTFSIRTAPLSEDQRNYLSDISVAFSLFSGLPQMEWMKAAESNMRLSLNSDPAKPIFSIEDNINEKVTRLLPLLAEHIRNKKAIGMMCLSPQYGDRHVTISPLYLKQFNRRWYLFGFRHEDNETKLYTLAVDEIDENSVKTDTKTHYHDEDIDWNAYFKQIIGVTMFRKNEVETISLKITDKMVCYLIYNNPIHEMQICEWCNDEKTEMILTLNVRRNWELMNFIRRYAGCIKVLQPESLKKDYVEFLRKGIELNEED